MKKKIVRSVILSLTIAAILTAAGTFLLSPTTTKVSGQQDRGWRLYIRTSPCSGRFDWLSVRNDVPPATYASYKTLLGRAPAGLRDCDDPSPSGCTFAQAEALREALRFHPKFFDFCCREYSVWRNDSTRQNTVVLGKSGNPGQDWRFVKGDLCCEEAEALAGIPGACSSSRGGSRGGGSGWGHYQNGSFNQGDGQTLTFYRGTTPGQCQADCDKNPKCVAFTLIKAGAFSPNDPPVCYLMSEAKKVTPSSCCITAIKNKDNSGGNTKDNSGKVTSGGPIQVVSGTYGANCGQPESNKTPHIAAACNGKGKCEYVIDYKVIGDPADGCAKNYIVKWRCGSNPKVFSKEVPPEAGRGRGCQTNCVNEFSSKPLIGTRPSKRIAN